MKILYTSAAHDSSGYAEAARNYICALSEQEGIELSLRMTSFEQWDTKIGSHYEKIMNPLIGKKMDPDVQIIHLTPENFGRFHQPGIKNIGYTVWETSKLPNLWVPMLNKMDEIWVPCDWNVKVFKESGVTVPVVKIPHTFHPKSFEPVELPERFNIDPSSHMFYSIFQWNARKNPEALLKAYWHEFTSEDDVCLVLKTYAYTHDERDAAFIRDRIQKLKKSMWVEDTPPVVFIHDTLSREEIAALHTRGNTFVLPHRAEGWGIPHFEAMAIDNTCIATNYSGNLEFMNENNSLLIDCHETPCSNMDRPTYNGKMMWAEPDVKDLANKMRQSFEADKLAQATGRSDLLKERPSKVLEKFSWNNIGAMMKERLCEL